MDLWDGTFNQLSPNLRPEGLTATLAAVREVTDDVLRAHALAAARRWSAGGRIGLRKTTRG